MTIVNPVQHIVLNCLNHFAYQDAIFLSERYHAEFKSEESLYLLALSYYKSGNRTLRAYYILKERPLKLPKSRYLLAKCCLELNKYGEAESVLVHSIQSLSSNSSNSGSSGHSNSSSQNQSGVANNSSTNSNTSASSVSTSNTNKSSTGSSSTSGSTSSSKPKLYDEIIKEYGPEYSSYVLQILATVYSKTDRLTQSVEFYKKSLRQNPFMWSSFEAICNIGEKIDTSKYFTYSSALMAYKNQIYDPSVQSSVISQSSPQSSCSSHMPLQSSQQQTPSHSTHHTGNVLQPPQLLQQQQLNVIKQPNQMLGMQPQQQQQQQSQQQSQQLTMSDQENDMTMLDAKCKQDLTQILKQFEDSKLLGISKQQKVTATVCTALAHPHHHHHHHHHHHLPQISNNQPAAGNKIFKENQSTDEQSQQQTVPCFHCCHCCTNNLDTTSTQQASTASTTGDAKSNKSLLNQVLSKSISSSSTSSGLGESQASTSTSSLSTPPTIITTHSNLGLAPPPKKCLSKRQTSVSSLSNKALFGQNTTNNLSGASNQNTIRRSSRIHAAHAVKENKKSSSNGSSLASSTATTPSSSATSVVASSSSNTLVCDSITQSSSNTSTASSTSSGVNSGQSKLNKRIKLKKNSEEMIAEMNEISDSSSTHLDTNTSSSCLSSTFNCSTTCSSSILPTMTDHTSCNACQMQQQPSVMVESSSTTTITTTASSAPYSECQHCNLLLNQSKNYNNPTSASLYNVANSQNINPLLPLAASLQHSSMGYLNQSRKSMSGGSKFNLSSIIEQCGYLEGLMKLFKDMAQAFYYLKQYECGKAIELFEQLPQHQLNSSFVLSQIARSHFELHNYLKAEKVYCQLRREFPYHLEGLEYYSTTLWHLQKEIALSALAQELTEYDKLAPETWCVVGNCFSLHKEHDAAIKFFQRATQVDPSFAYAYNLLGHEYFLIEEMDKGLSCFRKAIYLDPRHYNAWYGISMIHLKQEKFLLAEKYLKKALLINPHSSTLMCHIAVVYHSLKQSDKALQILNRALAIEPRNTLCKFHRASILFSMERWDDALEEFERLRRIVPKESLIYYMISKTHKKLRNVHLSLMYMSWAMDLDPKGVNNQLKESIDKRYVVDSDSTFARELETTQTSTLEAIYGGNEMDNQTNQNIDDENPSNANNNNDDLDNNNDTSSNQNNMQAVSNMSNEESSSARLPDLDNNEDESIQYNTTHHAAVGHNPTGHNIHGRNFNPPSTAIEVETSTATTNLTRPEEPTSSRRYYMESMSGSAVSTSIDEQMYQRASAVDEYRWTASAASSSTRRGQGDDEDIDEEAEYRLSSQMKRLVDDDLLNPSDSQETRDEADRSRAKKRDDDEDDEESKEEDQNEEDDTDSSNDNDEDDDDSSNDEPGAGGGTSGPATSSGFGSSQNKPGSKGGSSYKSSNSSNNQGASGSNSSNSQSASDNVNVLSVNLAAESPSSSNSSSDLANDIMPGGISRGAKQLSPRNKIKSKLMMNNLYRYRAPESDSALASSVAASMAGVASSFSQSSFNADEKTATREHHGHQKKQPASKKVVFPAANSTAGLLAPKKKLELEFRATINDDTNESNSDELHLDTNSKRTLDFFSFFDKQTRAPSHSKSIVKDLSTITSMPPPSTLPSSHFLDSNSSESMMMHIDNSSSTSNDSSTPSTQQSTLPPPNPSSPNNPSLLVPQPVIKKKDQYKQPILRKNLYEELQFQTRGGASTKTATSVTPILGLRKNLYELEEGEFDDEVDHDDEEEDDDDEEDEVRGARRMIFNKKAINDSTSHDHKLTNQSISFLSMNSVIDTTKNNDNETIPFLSQSQISVAASGQKVNKFNVNASLCQIENSSMMMTGQTDQLMDSVEEDL